ncbi:MAG: hypothetical protein ABI947_01965 [Chloroflexota bacterium]
MARIRRIILQEKGLYPVQTEKQPVEPARPKFRQAEKLGEKVNNLVSIYASMVGWEQKEIHTEWMRLGGKSQKLKDAEDMETKRKWLVDLIEMERKRRGESTS